jgi:hypothetical protein
MLGTGGTCTRCAGSILENTTCIARPCVLPAAAKLGSPAVCNHRFVTTCGAPRGGMMLLLVLASAGARPFSARSPAPRMAISASPPPTIAEYPSPALSPWDVVASQISALQAEDSAPAPRIPVATSPAPSRTPRGKWACRAAADVRTFRFASPECQRTPGKMKRMSVCRGPVLAPSRPVADGTHLLTF